MAQATAWPAQLLPVFSAAMVTAWAGDEAVTPGSGLAVLPWPPMPTAATTIEPLAVVPRSTAAAPETLATGPMPGRVPDRPMAVATQLVPVQLTAMVPEPGKPPGLSRYQIEAWVWPWPPVAGLDGNCWAAWTSGWPL